MKKTIKLALVATLALGATSAFATNGTNLIGYGAKSRAMGGTGISNFNGAESAFANPALITSSQHETDATIGATLLSPSVSFKTDAVASSTIAQGANPASNDDSTAGDGMIPSVAVINKINDDFAWALALYGVGGMGVDYRDEAGTTSTVQTSNDNLMLMRMSIPLAYTVNGFSVGIAPVIEYGALSMGTSFGTPGVTTDIAAGFEVGMAYTIAGVSLGFDYKSAVTHDFANTFNSDMTGGTQSELDTPAVTAVGVSYKMGASTIALDYKTIAYSSAAGFEDFLWEDQTVIAIGYEYAADAWAARVGYNYGASPLETAIAADGSNMNPIVGSLMMFPAVTEAHITFGGSYNFNKTMSMDLAYMIASGSVDVTTPDFGQGTGTITATNDQTSLSFALNYNY